MIFQTRPFIAGPLLALLIAPLAWGSPPSVPHAVADIFDRKVEAWNTGDAQGWGADYADDAVVINLFGTRLEGSEENITRHAEVFAGALADTTLTVDITRIHKLASDMAIVETHLIVANVAHKLEVLPLTDSGDLHTRMSFVIKNESDDNWQILFAQNTVIEDPNAEVEP